MINAFLSIDYQLLKKAYLSRAGKYLPLKLLIFMGDGPFWLMLLGVSTVIGLIRPHSAFLKLSLLILMGFSLAQLIFIPSKIFVKRRRPYADPELQHKLGITIENRDPGHGSKEMESFPSGHLYWTSMGVFFICHQFGWPGAILFGWMIPLMLYLRPYLGVHYPSDVLAGLIMGLSTAFVSVWLLPPAFSLHKNLEGYSWYAWVYMAFICLFIYFGYRSWQRRV